MRLFDIENSNILEIPEWVRNAFSSFKKTITSENPEFPCHFAKLGLENSSFRYSYINEDELINPLIFKTSLNAYLKSYKKLKWPSVFIVFINTDGEKTLQGHEEIFWNILQYLMHTDTEKRPLGIPENPENYKWQFCFEGTPLFITGHSSSYKNRISRHSASDMMLVIQTMDTLKPVAGNSNKSNRIRKVIRDRVTAYDKIPITNLLGSYPNKNSHEWKQFWLPDTNDDKKEKKCPLNFNNFGATE